MKVRTTQLLSPRQVVGWQTYTAIAVWLAVVAAAYWVMNRNQFATNDSPTATFAEHWPSGSQLPRNANHATLVLFMHPKCPCTQATLSELERLFTAVAGQADEKIEFVVDATIPEAADDDWLNTSTVKRAKAISNAKVFVDRGGKEASQFGATTSGFLMLFDENGSRQYAGGVTESRGHEGGNIGSNNLARILCHEINATESLPAFGCRLCLPDSEHPAVAVAKAGST
jgi:hypothetical protein